MILYHLTPVKNLPKIRKHGLVPSKRKGFTSMVDVDPSLRKGYLFFVDSLEGVGDLLTALAAFQGQPIKLAILKIKVPNSYPISLESDIDPDARGILTEFLVSRKSIKPESIEYLGTADTGYSTSPGSWGLSGDYLPKQIELGPGLKEELEKGSRASIFWSEYRGGEVPEEFKEGLRNKDRLI